MRILITESYGGKIDDQADFEHLTELVKSILTPAAFDDEHFLVEPASANDLETDTGDSDGGLKVPSGTGLQDFLQWINRLPEREPPTYLGLPANAGKLLLVGHGEETIANVARITEILDEGQQSVAEDIVAPG